MRKLSVFRGFVRVSRVISMARLRALYNPRPNVAANSDRQSRAYGLIDKHSHESEITEARRTTQPMTTQHNATNADACVNGDGGNSESDEASKSSARRAWPATERDVPKLCAAERRRCLPPPDSRPVVAECLAITVR